MEGHPFGMSAIELRRSANKCIFRSMSVDQLTSAISKSLDQTAFSRRYAIECTVLSFLIDDLAESHTAKRSLSARQVTTNSLIIDAFWKAFDAKRLARQCNDPLSNPSKSPK